MDVPGGLVQVETVERGDEHRLPRPRDLFGYPVFGDQPQEVLVLEPAHFPAWVEPGEEVKHLLVEEGVPRLDGGVHRHAVALAVEEQACEMDARGEIQPAV